MPIMTNAEAFEYDFGIYATELWSMTEEQFLTWLNSECDRERPRDMIVRCKDCKWWDRIDKGSYGYCHACKHAFYSSNWEISIYRTYKEDWYCAEGERKDDE